MIAKYKKKIELKDKGFDVRSSSSSGGEEEEEEEEEEEVVSV